MQQEQSPSGIVPTIPTIQYISLNILQKPEQDHTFGTNTVHLSLKKKKHKGRRQKQ